MSTNTTAPPAAGAARAPSQGGIIGGLNPAVYNPKDPIPMFIIQVCFLSLPQSCGLAVSRSPGLASVELTRRCHDRPA